MAFQRKWDAILFEGFLQVPEGSPSREQDAKVTRARRAGLARFFTVTYYPCTRTHLVCNPRDVRRLDPSNRVDIRQLKWSSGLESVQALAQYPDGRAKRVEYVYNFYIHKANYVLEYSYDDPGTTLTWKKAGGDRDIEAIEGMFKFAPRPQNTTAATYQIELTLNLIPSKRLVNWGTAILMRQELKNFKKFVETADR